MAEYVEREEFLKRIKPYDTSDKTDKSLYNFALRKMVETPNANVIPIPEGATNGEVFKAMFPNVVNSTMDLVDVLNNAKSWWNAPYKKESEKE